MSQNDTQDDTQDATPTATTRAAETDPATIFSDPVTYLLEHGIRAELVRHIVGLPRAA
jgi:hypothetical protein